MKNILIIGENPQKYGSGIAYNQEEQKNFEYHKFDDLDVLDNNPRTKQVYYFDNKDIMLDTDIQTSDIHFLLVHHMSVCNHIVFCKIENNKLYYRFSKDSNWKQAIQSEWKGTISSCFNNSATYGRFFRQQCNEIIVSVKHKLTKIYNASIRYGETYEIRYKDDYYLTDEYY